MDTPYLRFVRLDSVDEEKTIGRLLQTHPDLYSPSLEAKVKNLVYQIQLSSSFGLIRPLKTSYR